MGRRFVEERNFESLRDLVDSAIQKERNREAKGKEPLVRDFVGLITLKTKVDKYCSLLEIPEQEDKDFGDFDACEMWDDYD